ncbi:MAG: argininosuccinate synthase [Bacteroidetes bacterium]|nr:argininosuccinate synthase [Bacteroidota bacterium]MCL5737229.1 argininosuccinate synthase [Bacteroidota bacterium]
MSNVKKVVLAYSGGLDTSIIIPYLKETYNCQVIAYAANIGQGDDELEGLEQKAKKTGADKFYLLDLRKEFVENFLFKIVKANAVYERKYLLGTSVARPLIAKYQTRIAEQEGADALAHGCTGKGNDQVRFELTYKVFAPHLKVIAPWREWKIRSREDAIKYAEEHNVPIKATLKKIYSRDGNLWHLSHEGGDLEDPWNEPKSDMFIRTKSPEEAPNIPTYVEIEFQNGLPTAMDGKKYDPLSLVEKLNEIGAANAIGRSDLVENRLVGMKSRGVYETPGGEILYTAHSELEHIVLDKDTLHYKDLVAQRYAELVYNGLWYTPLREALDAFMDSTQRFVTGTVKLKLYKGSIIIAGRKSPYSLYQEELATFSQDEVYDQKKAEGFIDLFGLSMKVDSMVHGKPKE